MRWWEPWISSSLTPVRSIVAVTSQTATPPTGWPPSRSMLTGAYYSAEAAIPHLKERDAGKFITVGSGIGHRGLPGSSADTCSKAGLWMLTRVLAQELWPFKISVNELIPRPVVTEMSRDRQQVPQDSVLAIDSKLMGSATGTHGSRP